MDFPLNIYSKTVRKVYSACGMHVAYSSLHDEDNGNDESIESKGLSEDHHKDEGDEDIVLSIGAYTSISNYSNGETCSQ